MDCYGRLINIEHGNICVKISGTSDNVMVLLHGGGIASPVLELEPLANLLEKDYTVVIIEYFGYGFSDKTDRPRTIENITSEIHDVLQELGYTKYFLMAHSISGVYSLYYTNRYKDEVLAFVGIDISVPRQNEFFNTAKINLTIAHMKRFLNTVGVTGIILKLFPNILAKDAYGNKRSNEDTKILKKLYKNSANHTVIDELKNSTANFSKTAGMTFPKSVPVLLFLASDTCKQIKQWHMLHDEIIENKQKSKIITLTGSHFLYRAYAKEIVDSFSDFINIPAGIAQQSDT